MEVPRQEGAGPKAGPRSPRRDRSAETIRRAARPIARTHGARMLPMARKGPFPLLAAAVLLVAPVHALSAESDGDSQKKILN